MTDPDSVSRKKKVRAAHRASVTRMMAQAQDLTAEEGLDLPKLRHKREGIAAKAQILGKLDQEIVEEVHEDNLESEIEGADLVRERIELAIMELDSALSAAAEKRRDPGSEGLRVSELPIDPARDSSRDTEETETSRDSPRREGGGSGGPPTPHPSRSPSPGRTHTPTLPAVRSAFELARISCSSFRWSVVKFPTREVAEVVSPEI